MNRAERRRQEKSGKQPGSAVQPLQIRTLFSEAVSHHQARRFQQAEQLYERILSHDPSHTDALHLLGLVAYQQGDNPKAIQLISQAISANSNKPHYFFNLGLVMEKEGRLDEAISAYEKALTLNPSYTEAQSNLGNVFREQGKLDAAAQAFQAVLNINPRSAETHNNFGVVLKEQGNIEGAIGEYQAALQINPAHAEALNNLGVAYKEQGRLDEAKSSFQQALVHKPSYANAHYHLGLTSLWQQHMEEAMDCFRRSADLTFNHQKPVTIRSVAKARIKHDFEQVQYLLAHSLGSDLTSSYVEILNALYQRVLKDTDTSWFLPLTSQEQLQIAPSFNRILHYGKGGTLSGGTLNPDLNLSDIEARYQENKPEMMYVDHLLNPAALNSLRQFCLESTIWKRDYQNGYIGTFLANGFSCPLLLQIAEELRTTFPGIFKNHLLNQGWAFKHDSALRGLNMHADAAAVNVNFWITPDEANLDPDSGGLIVWNKEAPDEWDFKEYNNEKNEGKIREFLERNQAEAFTIPHRQNRAVIFNSNLFHKTDTISFKDDYENRRINVTLLYGSRQKAEKSLP
jgi:tetratricopeptide (TPR) repeat protein